MQCTVLPGLKETIKTDISKLKETLLFLMGALTLFLRHLNLFDKASPPDPHKPYICVGESHSSTDHGTSYRYLHVCVCLFLYQQL